jgi:hypothetical protein
MSSATPLGAPAGRRDGSNGVDSGPAAGAMRQVLSLAESDLESIGKIRTQGHQCYEGDNEEESETDNQHMFCARRACLARKWVQGFLPLRPCCSIGLKSWSLQMIS